MAHAAFAIVGTLGVAAPVAIYFAPRRSAGPSLDTLKTWMARNNPAIMAVLYLVLAAKNIGDAVTGFSL